MVFVVGAVLLVWVGRRQTDAQSRLLGRILGGLTALIYAAVLIYSFIPPSITSSVPLQLTDLATTAGAYALWSQRHWAVALTYYWGLVLSVQALISPVLRGPDFPNYQFLAFWAIHLLGRVGRDLPDLGSRLPADMARLPVRRLRDVGVGGDHADVQRQRRLQLRIPQQETRHPVAARSLRAVAALRPRRERADSDRLGADDVAVAAVNIESMTIALSFQDTIALLHLGDDENRFSPEFLDQFEAHLDDAISLGAHGLVTVSDGKFYSNGLDLDWLAAHGDQTQWYVGRVQALLARVLTLPMPTAAAIGGHAFGAAAMLALAHDFRVMRADRGYFCFPEVDIRIPFTPGMAALIQAKLTPQTAVAAMTTGRRFGGADAAALGIVDATAEEDAVVGTALNVLAPLGAKDPGTIGAIKNTMFAPAVAALTAVS